jgi:predicted MFS family arabinose efflux permease
LALLAVFTVRAARSERVGIVNVRLFARPAFAGAAGSLLLAGVYFYGGLILLPMYCARVAHLSALAVGSVVAVQGVGALVGRSALTRLAPRAGTRPVVLVGVCCAVVATLPFALPGRHPLGLMLAALLLRGAGVGIATVAILGSVYHGLEGADIPHASSMSRIVLQVGGALGVALVSGVLAQALRTAGTEGAFSEPFWWLDAATVIALAPAVLLPGGASRVRAVVYLPRHAQ